MKYWIICFPITSCPPIRFTTMFCGAKSAGTSVRIPSRNFFPISIGDKNCNIINTSIKDNTVYCASKFWFICCHNFAWIRHQKPIGCLKHSRSNHLFGGTTVLTSKPIEPTPSTLKADLVAFVNSNMLIMNIIGKNSQWLCVSSTSASKFEFLELPISTGSTQFEFKFAGDTNLKIYISRSPIYSGRTLEFILFAAHARIYNINVYNTGI